MHGVSIGMFKGSMVSQNIDQAQRQMSISLHNILTGEDQENITNPATASLAQTMRSRIDELTEGMKQVQEQISMLEASRTIAMVETDVVLRIKELAVQYQNDTLSDSDKDAIQAQVDELAKVLFGDDITDKYSSSLQISHSIDAIGEEHDLSQYDLTIKAEQTAGDSAYVLYTLDEIGVEELSLSDIMAGNEAFLNVSSETLTYTYDAQTREERHAIDLESDGILSQLDKMIDRYAGNAAEISARISTLHYRLEYMSDQKGLAEEALNNATATDMAEETAELIKSKLQSELGVNILKIQQNLEKNMVLSLLL